MITGVLLLKITLGHIGNKENWRIIAILLAFIFFMLCSILMVKKVIKK
jgi:hypothetical protein